MITLNNQKDKFLNSVRRVERVWTKELKPLVTFIPDFKNVYNKILESIK